MLKCSVKFQAASRQDDDVEIRSEIDIKRLSNYLKKRLNNGDVVSVNLEQIDAPTNRQLRTINVLPRELARQSLMRGFDGMSADDFRDLIVNLFLSDYFELLPDGTLTIKKASFKHGLTKYELNRIIEAVIEYFNSEFGFDLYIRCQDGEAEAIEDKDVGCRS